MAKIEDLLAEDGRVVQEALKKQGVETESKLKYRTGNKSVTAYLTISERGRLFRRAIITLKIGEIFGAGSASAHIHRDDYREVLTNVISPIRHTRNMTYRIDSQSHAGVVLDRWFP